LSCCLVAVALAFELAAIDVSIGAWPTRQGALPAPASGARNRSKVDARVKFELAD
jgi:hypothetical protein